MFGKIIVPFVVLAFLSGIIPSAVVGQSGVVRYTDLDRGQSCPSCNHNLPRISIDGWKGLPYSDPQTDGCRCGQKSSVTWYNGSRHWPSPFSVLLDHGRDGQRWGRRTETTTRRLTDKLDVLSNVRLLPSIRKDNGYTGPHCDPYGLVGESRRGIPTNLATPSINENARKVSQPTGLPEAHFRYPVKSPARAVISQRPQMPTRRAVSQTQIKNHGDRNTDRRIAFAESRQEPPRRVHPPMRYPADPQPVTKSNGPTQNNQEQGGRASKQVDSPRYPLLSPADSSGPATGRQMQPGPSYPRRYPLDPVPHSK